MRHVTPKVVLGVAAVLAVVSALVDFTTMAELSGQADTWASIRKTIARTINSGSVWAGLGILAGFSAGPRRWLRGAALGAGILLLTTALHYAVGVGVGIVPADGFVSNAQWFVAAAVFGLPLGLIGVAAHSHLLARLVLPLGMIAEPWVTRRFFGFYGNLPSQVSEIASGIILTLLGVILGVLVLRLRRRTRSTSPAAGSSDSPPPSADRR
ncbi:hypothetical protein [Corynebacterium sp.]|uniref:hypothetical protein n=1 Tax=Corynebacterium sp. TaxID=1720 RepID=UPI0026E09F83|nr:hypothetical protein [Corynebacterium sp.]MDO5511366.1 hypothetical protein [Corynebacterium sp.]